MSIFSTYSQGENRITATLLAVLQQLSLSRIDFLLGALLEDEHFSSITFANQPSSGGEGVPDAEISSGMHILLETKIERNTVNESQLIRHLKRFGAANPEIEVDKTLAGPSTRNQKLIVLTPDSTTPTAIQNIEDNRIVWANFQLLNSAIDELIDDPKAVVSEREQFMLREFQALMSNSQLLSPEKDTVIVPAKNAWAIYQNASVYSCQVNRSFQPAVYIGFYNKQQIQPTLAKILEIHDNVTLLRNMHEGELGLAVNSLLDIAPDLNGISQKIFVLSPIDSADSIQLPNAIQNDSKSYSGKTVAFTQSQRYVVSDQLNDAKFTSDIGKPRDSST